MLIEKNVLLSPFTTIKIGGIARYFASPKSLEELIYALAFARDKGLGVFVLGRGANTIFGDFDGLVLHMKAFRELKVQRSGEGFEVFAQAGTSLQELISLSLKEHLEGIYRLAGFPATVGGAVAMNAGAFGVEAKDFLKEVFFLDWEGNLHGVRVEEIPFSYRSSPFPEWGVVVSAVFKFKRINREVKKEYEAIRKKRKATQPLHLPTSGSTFKNPEGEYAGRLLERAGMKGFRVGDVAFSELHANFLVNLGEGKFSQVVKIIQEAKKRVFEEFGINLEEEVRLVEGGGTYGWKVSGARDIFEKRAGGP